MKENTKKLLLFLELMDLLSSDFGTMVKVSVEPEFTGTYDCDNNLIILDLQNFNDTDDSLWSVFFHELGHAYCKSANIYPKLHSSGLVEKGYIRRMALRMERYVDSIGEGFMKIYFPELKYVPGYRDPSALEKFRAYMKREYS